MMKNKFSLKSLSVIMIAFALIFITAISAPPAKAAEGYFDLSVFHGINGNDLGLDKELPVNVYLNGNIAISDFRFGESVNVSLPAGTYRIDVALPDGTLINSMRVGPVEIPGDVDVMAKATLDFWGNPVTRVSISESMPEMQTFRATVVHNIDGRDLGLPSELPVDVYINDALALNDFEYGDKVVTNLPEGAYTIQVRLQDGTLIDSMSVGPVFVEAGSDLTFKARLNYADTPIIRVTAR